MVREVHLNELSALLAELTFPVDRSSVLERFDDVVLQYADGREPLTDVLARVSTDRFESADELQNELYNELPVEAVGEPGQSEGEG